MIELNKQIKIEPENNFFPKLNSQKNLNIAILAHLPAKDVFFTMPIVNSFFRDLIRSDNFLGIYHLLLPEQKKYDPQEKFIRSRYIKNILPFEQGRFSNSLIRTLYTWNLLGKALISVNHTGSIALLKQDGVVLFVDNNIKSEIPFDKNTRPVSINIQGSHFTCILDNGTMLRGEYQPHKTLKQFQLKNFNKSLETQIVESDNNPTLICQKNYEYNSMNIISEPDCSIIKEIEFKHYICLNGFMFYVEKNIDQMSRLKISEENNSFYCSSELSSKECALVASKDGVIHYVPSWGVKIGRKITFTRWSQEIESLGSLSIDIKKLYLSSQFSFQTFTKLPGKLFLFDTAGTLGMLDIDKQQLVWSITTEKNFTKITPFSYANEDYLAIYFSGENIFYFIKVNNGDWTSEKLNPGSRILDFNFFESNGRLHLAATERSSDLERNFRIYTQTQSRLPTPNFENWEPQPPINSDDSSDNSINDDFVPYTYNTPPRKKRGCPSEPPPIKRKNK